jgi:hypothetical protein
MAENRKWTWRFYTLEAMVALLVVGLLRRFFPPQAMRQLLGQPIAATQQSVDDTQTLSGPSELSDVIWFVSNGIRRANWRIKFWGNCLDQALAASLMLRRRGIHHQLIIGLSKPSQSLGTLSRWDGHAWLSCGHQIVVGAEEAPGFVPALRFDFPPRADFRRPPH